MITIENWGLISYSEAWERQTALFDELIDAKLILKLGNDKLLSSMNSLMPS